MPSEVIYGNGGNVDIRVSWGNDESGTVQVVSQAAARDSAQDQTQRVIDVVNDWLAAAGEPIIDLEKLKAALPYAPHFDGWWATLDDWGSANRLIKVLQRARDRAFGAPA